MDLIRIVIIRDYSRCLSYSEIVGARIRFFLVSHNFYYWVNVIITTSRKRNNIASGFGPLFGFGIVFYIPQLSSLFDIGFAGIVIDSGIDTMCWYILLFCQGS